MQPTHQDATKAATLLPFEATDSLTTVFSSVAAKNSELIANSFQAWAEESRSFLQDMARDGAEAMQALQSCKTPMDVIAVEQSWLAARSSAYLDAGRRLFTAPPKDEALDAPLPE